MSQLLIYKHITKYERLIPYKRYYVVVKCNDFESYFSHISPLPIIKARFVPRGRNVFFKSNKNNAYTSKHTYFVICSEEYFLSFKKTFD